jgi:hypothetical protein
VRRQRDEADVAAGRSLPTLEFIEVGRADILHGMRATGPVGGVDMRALHVKSGDRATARQGGLSAMQVSQTGEHAIGRSGDYGGQTAGHAGGEDGIEGAADVLSGMGGVVEIDAGEAVHLEVDKSGSEKNVWWRTWIRANRLDGFREFHCHWFAVGGICSRTDHERPGLFTKLQQASHRVGRANGTIEERKKLLKCASGCAEKAGSGKLSHDTTEADWLARDSGGHLGGDSRGWGCARSRLRGVDSRLAPNKGISEQQTPPGRRSCRAIVVPGHGPTGASVVSRKQLDHVHAAGTRD